MILEMKEIEFSAKFAQKMKFHENRGSFKLKLNIRDPINSIMGVKICILDFITLYSHILVSF